MGIARRVRGRIREDENDSLPADESI